MRSLRRCLMRSSRWPQNLRKYCAAETRALTTTSHRSSRASGFNRGWRAPAIKTATAQTCKTILVLPRTEAAMVKPSAEAMLRRPRTVNSRPMMMTTIQAGTSCMPTREMKAAAGEVAIGPIRGGRQQQDRHAPELKMHRDAPQFDVGAAGQQDHDEHRNKEDTQQRQ